MTINNRFFAIVFAIFATLFFFGALYSKQIMHEFQPNTATTFCDICIGLCFISLWAVFAALYNRN